MGVLISATTSLSSSSRTELLPVFFLSSASKWPNAFLSKWPSLSHKPKSKTAAFIFLNG
jgi:hypothetical protein